MEEAVYSDCQCLVENFVQNGKASFEIFCSEWKRMGFQHIFSAQTTYIELQQTANAAFYIGKNIICNRNSVNAKDNDANEKENLINSLTSKEILYRIGGLYLIYAIYFKQPLKQYTKIEVSLKTWKKIKHFITEILPADKYEYDEARYTFWKLIQSQAFRFTALDYCIGLESLVDYDDLDKNNITSIGNEGLGKLMDKITNFKEINETTPALVALEEGYNEMKHALTQMHKLDGQLLPPIKIFQSIHDSFANIEKMLNQSQTLEEGPISSHNASLKRCLKDKAYGTVNSVTISKHSSKIKSPPSQKKFRRMSARSIFIEKLPKNMESDFEEDECSDSEYDDEQSSENEESEITKDDCGNEQQSIDKEILKNMEDGSKNLQQLTGEEISDSIEITCQNLLNDL